MIRERLQYNTCHKQIFMPSQLIVNGPRVAVHKGPFRCPRCRTDSQELPQGVPVVCRGCGLTLHRLGDLLEISDAPQGHKPSAPPTEPGTSTSKPPDPTDSNPPEGKDDPGKGKSDPKGKKKGA